MLIEPRTPKGGIGKAKDHGPLTKRTTISRTGVNGDVVRISVWSEGAEADPVRLTLTPEEIQGLAATLARFE